MKNAILRCVVLGACAVFLNQQLSSFQATGMLELLRRVGWAAVLVLIPSSLATIADTIAWKACITTRPRIVSLMKLLPIRVSCDAVCNSLPAGIAPGEMLRMLLLHDRFGLDLTEGAGCCLLAKVNMALAHATYVFIVVVFLLLGVAEAIKANSLPGGTAGLLCGGCLAAAFGAILIQPYTGTRISQVFRRIGHAKLQWLQGLEQRLVGPLERIDNQIGEFAHCHAGQLQRSLASFFAGWIALGSESVVILFLLGTNVSPLAGLTMEAVVSVLRIIFFVLPSAIGAAEVAYIGFLTAMGVPDPVTVSAAFIAIKRSREALWILVGYALLLKIMPVGRERSLLQLTWKES